MKLSVIIPIYNVEQYLRRCVDSVLNQDYKDYEIILVDDGGTDGCPAICDEYVVKSERVKELKSEGVRESGKSLVRVIHRENGGLSAARNSGIEVAKGEYLMFVDSDDYIEPNVLGNLMKQVERDNLDVLRYKHQYVHLVRNERVKELKSEGVRETIVRDEARKELGNEREYEVYSPYKTDPYKGHDYSSEVTDGVTFLNTRFGTTCYAWNFIVKRSLLVKNEGVKELKSECLFTPGIYFEDVDWTPRMLVRAKRVASTETIVYNYLLTRQGSITNAVNKGKQKKVLEDKMHLLGTLQSQAKELEQKGLSNAWFSRMIADNVISIVGIISADFYGERKEYIERLKKIGVLPINSKSMKGRMVNISPRLMIELLHFKNA